MPVLSIRSNEYLILFDYAWLDVMNIYFDKPKIVWASPGTAWLYARCLVGIRRSLPTTLAPP
jgi:hypothetical protein